MTTFVFFWGLERSTGACSMPTTDLLYGLYVSYGCHPKYDAAIARVYAL